MSGAGAMTQDVMCSGGGGGLDTGHWLETGDSDSDDAGARAGADPSSSTTRASFEREQ